MTLLDIGGGIGAIQHELLDAGVTRATCVDASAPFLDAARQEGASRGHDGRVTYMHGDFVDLADTWRASTRVTRARVARSRRKRTTSMTSSTSGSSSPRYL